MNLRQALTLLLVGISGTLCGCGSFFSGGATTHLLYVSTGQGIYAYRVDNKSGTATQIPSSPFYAGNTPAGMVIDASGDHAYVANQVDNTISLLTIDHSSGVLTEVLPRTSVGGFSPNQIALDSTGTTLFVGNQLSNNVAALSIGVGGKLTAPTGTQVVQISSSPGNMAFANGFLFVAAPTFGQVYIFSASSGNLSPVSGSPVSMSNGVGSVTVDPSAKYLYVTNPSINTISGFTIQSSGSNPLSAMAGSPFAPNVGTGTSPSQPIAAVLDATATQLYVANYGSSNVSLFSVGTNGALTSMTSPTAPAGGNPRLMSIDPNGNFLLVGNVGAKSISELPIKSDGTLSSALSIPLPSVPQALAVTK